MEHWFLHEFLRLAQGPVERQVAATWRAEDVALARAATETESSDDPEDQDRRLRLLAVQAATTVQHARRLEASERQALQARDLAYELNGMVTVLTLVGQGLGLAIVQRLARERVAKARVAPSAIGAAFEGVLPEVT